MTTAVLLVFFLVYAGMILGRWPLFQLDRTGIALLGAIGVIAIGAVEPERAWRFVDMPTLVLLFAFMVISAQLRLGGFYSKAAMLLLGQRLSPAVLLAAAIGVSGVLSAIFTNDIICLAMAPVVLRGCSDLKMNPIPFLLALACGANVGSAATLIGNPQNILIGQALGLSFNNYMLFALPPVTVGLLFCWIVIHYQYRHNFYSIPAGLQPDNLSELPPFVPWQAAKGLFVTFVLFICFVAGPWPRDILALAGAGVLLLSRKMHSRQMLGLVDWQLLVLFCGLFIVNGVLQETGQPALWVAHLQDYGIDLHNPGWLVPVTLLLSNLVSNVPAVMLLLPVAEPPYGGPILALVSTLSGNMFIVGSIANIIVADSANRSGIRFGWRIHARTGIPVTFGTIIIAVAWLLLVSR